MSLFKEHILGAIANDHGLIIDTHTHIGLSLSHYVRGKGRFCQSIEELKLKMDTYGVDYSIVFPFPDLNKNKVERVYYDAGHGFFESEDYPYQLANNYMFSEIIRNNYQVFLPFMIINPKYKIDKQIDCFEKYQDYNFGFKIHTTSNEISPIDIPAELVEVCVANKLPIIFHTRACQEQYNCWSVIKFAVKHPEINVCVAHCAGFDKSFFEEIHNINNVFFDVSPLLSLCYLASNGNQKVISTNKLELDYSNCVDVFMRLFDLAPNRILWATDDPCGLSIPDKYRLQVAMFKESDKYIKAQIQKNVYAYLTNSTHE